MGKLWLNSTDIKCKNCIKYKATIGTEQELTGHMEATVMPYGKCLQHGDTVREDEWCGAYKDAFTASLERLHIPYIERKEDVETE